jgi:hypothetical protein
LNFSSLIILGTPPQKEAAAPRFINSHSEFIYAFMPHYTANKTRPFQFVIICRYIQIITNNLTYCSNTCQAKNGKPFWRFMAQKRQTGWD